MMEVTKEQAMAFLDALFGIVPGIHGDQDPNPYMMTHLAAIFGRMVSPDKNGHYRLNVTLKQLGEYLEAVGKQIREGTE